MTRDRSVLPQSPSGRKKMPQYWRWFLPPMLLVSLGLHGLILFTPVAPSEDDLVPPPDPEEDGIAITKIDAPTSRAVRTQAPTAAPTAVPNNSTPTANRAPATTPSRPQTNQANNSTNARRNQANRNQANRNSRGSGNNRNPSARNNNQASNQRSQDNPSSTPVANNPNPTAPEVKSPAQIAFEEYVDVFSGYLGLKTISEADAATFRAQWLSSFTEGDAAYANLAIQPLNNLDQIPYEAKICLPSNPDSAQILALVEADGSLNEFIRVVQSTGYRSFDETANSLLQKHTFPSAETPQAYLVEVEVDYDPENCEWPPKLDKLPDDYFALLQNYIGPNLTTQPEFKAAQETWLTAMSQAEGIELSDEETPEVPEFEAFEGEVEYPLNICLPIPPKDSEWGVVVGPDGTLQGEVEPLRSTGYSNFDERSKELITSFDFPAAEATQLYIVKVPVDYNSLLCQALDSEEFTVSPAVAAATNTEAAANTETPTETNRDRPSQNSPNALAFNPSRQEELRTTAQQNLNDSEFGSVNSDPGLVAGIIDSGWPEGIERDAFLSDLNPESGPTPVDGATDAFVLTRNADLTPDSLTELYSVESELASEDYQGAPLYELSDNGVPQLFASVIGIGAGNSSTLVVIWPSDPRQEAEATSTPPPSEPAETPAADETPSQDEATPETPSQEPQEAPTINPRGLGMLLLEALGQL